MFLRSGKFWFLRTHELQLLAKTYGQCINSAPTSHNARQKHETCRDRYLVTFVLDWALHPLQTNLWHARLTWHGRWPVHKPWFKSDTLKVQLRKRLIISIVSWQGKQNVPKKKPRQCASSSKAVHEFFPLVRRRLFVPVLACLLRNLNNPARLALQIHEARKKKKQESQLACLAVDITGPTNLIAMTCNKKLQQCSMYCPELPVDCLVVETCQNLLKVGKKSSKVVDGKRLQTSKHVCQCDAQYTRLQGLESQSVFPCQAKRTCQWDGIWALGTWAWATFTH